MNSETHARFIAILCRADNGCPACISTLLAHYCLDFCLPTQLVADVAADIAHVPNDLLVEWINDKKKEIVAASPANEIPV